MDPDAPHLTAGGVVPDCTEAELATRWAPAEAECLAAVKHNLQEELASRIAVHGVSAVTSDRRMMRFIKRFGNDVDKSTEGILAYWQWRADMKVDAMHDRILAEQLTPDSLPHGKRIMELLPQIPCSSIYRDKFGNPISIEYYGFNPGECAWQHLGGWIGPSGGC